MGLKLRNTLLCWGAAGAAVGIRFFFLGNSIGGVFCLMTGAVLIAAGLGYSKHRSDFRKRLMSEGFRVEADFDGAEKSVFNSRYNHRHGIATYTIKCSYREPTTGIVYNYRSEELKLCFGPSFELNHGKPLNVYVNSNNPSEYYVDVEFLIEQDKMRR
ncbi:MAG: hypothetical protein NC395_01980 [Prevotella sp.]|nr:hypothetical protein [Prevotella sp.]